MKINEIIELFSSRETVRDAFLSALPMFFGDITVKEVHTDNFTAKITEDVDFLAIYPSQNHGNWFLVRSTAPRFTISQYGYKKAIMYSRETNTVTVISIYPPLRRVIEVPPL